MKEGDEFYEIKALVSKLDIDTALEDMKSVFRNKSSIVFNALENSNIKVYEIEVHSASARIQKEHITLDVSGNGDSTKRNGFERHLIQN